MAVRFSMDWAWKELIPFLMTVFRNEPGYKGWQHGDWERDVLFATEDHEGIPFYEDFLSTIEQLRLRLFNPSILSIAEYKKFSDVKEGGVQHCIRIFVRHAIYHGVYELYSLGSEASRDFPRAHAPDAGVGASHQRCQGQVKKKPLQGQPDLQDISAPQPNLD
ncbi:hypothetical protein EJ02DRAFT_438769 [Clathrospora elynae]|uniref:Uncharacterized protein n=1 Tax=Clathrospora elynae TaxID=706981 RepID=A0A6A5S7T3_9PLEO|nr:hypothetical protein EJ02DRAFT_438769 [Clathrospora elynae]